MIKIISPSWDFDRQVASLIKISSRGLRGNDRADLVKSAGAELVRAIDNVKMAAGEEPVHVIALGELSHWGANRNGDAFTEDECRACHPTFVKYARWYRAHKNRPPHPSYGVIKASIYNEPMKRVELLVGLNATKEAAERNGGLLADKEMEKLARGDDLPVSMSCSVPYDICSYCHNQARTRAEYCTPEMCKAGGCKDNLAKLVKVGGDVHHLHVRNKTPRFFDMSMVLRGADRTAYGSSAEWMSKAASDAMENHLGGALLAEMTGVCAPLPVAYDQALEGCPTESARAMLKLARAMHGIDMTPLAQAGGDVLYAFAGRPTPDLTFLGRPGTKEAAAGLAALAEQRVILPLTAFASWVGLAGEADRACQQLPGVYGRMIGDGSLVDKVASADLSTAGSGHMNQRRAAFQLKEAFGLGEEEVQARCWRAFVRRDEPPVRRSGFTTVKSAADTGSVAEKLARDYAAYQLAALYKIASFDDALLLTVRLCMAQNQV